MLAEIEGIILRVLRERLASLPEDSILIEDRPSKLPAITIANKGFKIEKSGLSEVQEERRIEEEERFPIGRSGESLTRDEGTEVRAEGGLERDQRRNEKGWTTYKLRHRPLKEGGVRVQCPPGKPLKEGIDYFVNFEDGSIRFPEAPSAEKRTILVRYSYDGAFAIKGLKLLARYAIDTFGKDRAETDSIAERIVRTFLSAEEELAMEGINVRLIGGRTMAEEREGARANGKVRGVRLLYLFEKELRMEKPMPPIERIEIAGKEVLKP